MRVLISTDIEGVAGIYHRVQTTPGNPEYERARVLMTREANAAVAGAFDDKIGDQRDGFGMVELDAPLQPLARHDGGHGDEQFVFFPRCQVHGVSLISTRLSAFRPQG